MLMKANEKILDFDNICWRTEKLLNPDDIDEETPGCAKYEAFNSK